MSEVRAFVLYLCRRQFGHLAKVSTTITTYFLPGGGKLCCAMASPELPDNRGKGKQRLEEAQDNRILPTGASCSRRETIFSETWIETASRITPRQSVIQAEVALPA